MTIFNLRFILSQTGYLQILFNDLRTHLFHSNRYSLVVFYHTDNSCHGSYNRQNTLKIKSELCYVNDADQL